MTPPVRARGPRRSTGSHRARNLRSRAAAALLVVLGAFLGWAVPVWERHLPSTGLGFDASTAQATLAAIAGGMITLAGFIVTAITLVIQTVQSMSPRLVAALGHFSRYLVLFGLLIGTALYALVALSQVRESHVPRGSVTFAVGLVLVDSVVVLHLLASLRHAVTGGGLARAVGERLRTVIDQAYPPGPAVPAPPTGDADRAARVSVLHGGGPAVLLSVDEPKLVRIAARHDLRIRFVHAIGDFVGAHDTVAFLEPAHGRGGAGTRLAKRVAGCVRYGPSRTVEQDAPYGFRLLADITVRALSPAVNDPTTAVQSLDQIEDALLRLSQRSLGDAWLLDATGTPRVSYPSPGWEDLVSLALDETLMYGSSSPQVVRRLRALLERVAAAAPTPRRGELARRTAALERLSSAALSDPLLSAVADVPDRQGLGGSAPRDHPLG
ncbi:DUF2254 family protein [Streptomyces sp. NPDC001933]|uniref:DUF2254 family protein n=1 Tax=Streptomyces sp. NPDC001933 TaxID=3364626 RepID=UPI00369BCB92